MGPLPTAPPPGPHHSSAWRTAGKFFQFFQFSKFSIFSNFSIFRVWWVLGAWVVPERGGGVMHDAWVGVGLGKFAPGGSVSEPLIRD